MKLTPEDHAQLASDLATHSAQVREIRAQAEGLEGDAYWEHMKKLKAVEKTDLHKRVLGSVMDQAEANGFQIARRD